MTGFKHGHKPTVNGKQAPSPEYLSWYAMKQRCLNPKHMNYPRYGGRGITIDPRWMRFENFYADMGDRPAGHTIERKNNNGPYTKANCQWAVQTTQVRNSTAVVITKAIADQIRADYLVGNISQRRLAQKYSISQATISNVLLGRSWN